MIWFEKDLFVMNNDIFCNIFFIRLSMYHFRLLTYAPLNLGGWGSETSGPINGLPILWSIGWGVLSFYEWLIMYIVRYLSYMLYLPWQNNICCYLKLYLLTWSYWCFHVTCVISSGIVYCRNCIGLMALLLQWSGPCILRHMVLAVA